MIKILDTTKTLSTLASDTSNGLGQVRPITGTVTEELNGIYELEFVVATDEKRFGELAVGGIVKVKAGDTEGEQMFRIYDITTPMNARATVKATHISYDLNKVVVQPFNATGASATVTALLSNAINNAGFTMTTDITNTTSAFELTVPMYFRECLGGWEGSVLDTFRCEYEWDNLTVKMLSRRGADNGVQIRYGKNLTEFMQEKNSEKVYTAVLGYAYVNDTAYVGNVYTKVASAEPKILLVDFTSSYAEGQTPTVNDLTTKATTYATNNPIETPKNTLTMSFVPLWSADEYKGERHILPTEYVGLGDTVYVYYPKMNITATARAVKRVWNVVKNRYEYIELGDTKSTFSAMVDSAIDDLDSSIEKVGNKTVSLQGQINNLQGQINNLDTLPYKGEITNCDSATDLGRYYGTSETSSSPVSSSFSLVSFPVGSAVAQVAFIRSVTGRMWFRTSNINGAFSTWKEISDKTDIDNLSAVNTGTEDVTWNTETTQIATKSNNVLYKVNGIAWIYLRFTTGATYTSGMNIATLPTGYRPKTGAYYSLTNLTTRTSPAVCTVNTNGTINFYGGRGDASSQYVLTATWVVA